MKLALGNNAPLVLIVDDQSTMRLFASVTLKHAGFKVIEAENGIRALSLFQQSMPDVILLDVVMPELDGFGVCKAIRTLPEGQHVPILMMTGIDDENAITLAYDAGATDFVGKPISRIVLPHRMRYMLRAKHTADKLRESEARLAHAQRLAKLGNWHWDISRRYVHCSHSCRHILGLEINEFNGTYKDLLGLIDATDTKRIETAINKALQTRNSISLEHRIVRKNDLELTVHHSIEAVTNEKNQVIGVMGTVQDISERKKAEKRIYSLAYQDQLTGLSNRTFLREFLPAAISQAERNNCLLALLYLDLDHFKRINDTLGHSAGDQLLREVGTRLRHCVRDDDMVGRYISDGSEPLPTTIHTNSIARLGGDEFIIVLSHLQQAGAAAQVAQRIIDEFAEPIVFHSHEIFISTSIGITVYPSDGKDVETLLKNADMAMYYAKEKGRNVYKYYKKSLNQTVIERHSIEHKLRQAIKRKEFSLQYQPRLDINTGQLKGLEALIRWHPPTGDLILPLDFIPFAEESGLIVPIGDWVLHTACQQNKAWQASGMPAVRVAVNLSARQFKERNLEKSIIRILNETGLDPQYLELEITEGMLMEDTGGTKRTLNALKTIGITIAIDDFGTGYSSLNYLTQFPIDILKIDKSFINDFTANPDKQTIVRAIISMAHSLNMTVIAEGVEQRQQVELLKQYGCDEVQGYFFSPPLPESCVQETANTLDADRDFYPNSCAS